MVKAGQLFRIKSPEQIRLTLDTTGALDGLPFMPEMLQYCGQIVRVNKVAHKTCDTVNQTGGRTVTEAVHLNDLRCSGRSHGNCDAQCLLFWKLAWLEPADDSAQSTEKQVDSDMVEEFLGDFPVRNKTGYMCQATRLPEFTSPLPWWDIRQYLKDIATGNTPLGTLLSRGSMKFIQNRIERGTGYRFFLSLYNRIKKAAGGMLYPDKQGQIEKGQRTPSTELNLTAGEWVEVKSYAEIIETLDTDNKNRGMRFDIEMKPYCGRRLRVKSVVKMILNEKTGEPINFGSQSVILDGAICQSKYSSHRMFCPRQIPSFWREVWLKRCSQENVPPNETTPGSE